MTNSQLERIRGIAALWWTRKEKGNRGKRKRGRDKTTGDWSESFVVHIFFGLCTPNAISDIDFS